jgi:hypothetical protein
MLDLFDHSDSRRQLMDVDQESVAGRLLALEKQCDELMTMVGGPDPQGASKAEAQARLTSLKDSLRSTYEKHKTFDCQSLLTTAERESFFPAVHEAMSRLKISAKSRPTRSAWFDELSACRAGLKRYRRLLACDK